MRHSPLIEAISTRVAKCLGKHCLPARGHTTPEIRNPKSPPLTVIGLPDKGVPIMSSRILVCALLLVASLRAQVATGTIVGVVQDATGAVVPNAQVNVLHVATAESRQTRSNER